MNRRNVLKTLAGLGAASAFPATAFTGRARPTDRSPEPAPSGMVTETDTVPGKPRIGLIAVGGSGCKVLSELNGKLAHLDRSIAIDTDPAELQRLMADRKLLINGRAVRNLDNHARSQIDEAVADLDLVFMVVGMDGTAGTTLAPQIAEVLRAKQIPTFAAVLTPSGFDARRGDGFFQNEIDELCRLTTASFPIAASLRDRWFLPRRANTIQQLYRSITGPLCESGFINLDLTDYTQILAGGRGAAMGCGSARGKNAATTATLRAIAHPLLGEEKLRNASGVLVLIETAGAVFHMQDAIKVPPPIRNVLTDFYDGHLLFGALRTESMADDFRVTILSSGTHGAFGRPTGARPSQ